MLLVDRDIKKRIDSGSLIRKNEYDEKNVNCISYDLTVDCFVRPNETLNSYELAPGEFIMLRTKEYLIIPDDTCGIIGEKNSRIRQGLVVSGPRYFPGHQTYGFLRVQNISSNTIVLSSGDKIAQIFFEKLSGKPDVPYSRQKGASFNKEEKYVGYGKYKKEYEENERSFQEVKESILEKEHQIYSNVLTFMGIIVAVFSLISINYDAFVNAQIGLKFIVILNLTLTLCICVLMGLILFVINNAKKKKFVILYLIILVLLIVGIVVSYLFVP